MSKSKNGLYLTGKLVGHRSITGTSQKDGSAYTLNFVGLSMPVLDGYAGQTHVVDVQLNDNVLRDNPLGNIAPTFFAAVDKLVGKNVSIAVYIRAYPNRGGAAYSYNVAAAGESTFVVVD